MAIPTGANSGSERASFAQPFAMVGDKIHVSGRVFRVVHKSKDHLEVVKHVVEQLAKCTSEELEATLGKTLSVSRAYGPQIKVQFSDEGPRVSRGSLRGQPLQVLLQEVNPKLADSLPPAMPKRGTAEYWVKSVKVFLEKEGHSKDAVKKAVDLIFHEGHLRLLDVLQGGSGSDWGEKTIADLLQEPGNESLREALLHLESSYTLDDGRSSSPRRREEACYNDLKVFVLKALERSVRVVQINDTTQMRQQFVQGSSRLCEKIIDGQLLSLDEIGTRGRGFPSEADKGKYRNDIIHNNTNLGTIVTFDARAIPQRVVAVRSGKSDTFERLQEHVLEACMQQLLCREPKGLIDRGNGRYDFHHAITSYLDPSALKSIGEKVIAGAGEREFLTHILEQLDKWPKEGIVVQLADGAGGRAEVTLNKPIICSQLLSSTVRGVGNENKRVASMGQAASDNINFIANIELLSLYPGVHDDERLTAAKKAFEAHVTKELGAGFSINNLVSNKAIFTSSEASIYKREVREFLLQMEKKDALLAKALFALFFRQKLTARNDFSFVPEPKDEMHVADIEIFRNIVLDKLNVSMGKECKSGTDRTAIGVALACAQEHFTIKFGKVFDPTPGSHTQNERLWFKTFYREALKEMGAAIVCETKGYSGLKWGGGIRFIGGVANPSAYKYLYLEEDLAPLKSEGISSVEKADVIDLTNQDLYEKGTLQYRGKLRHSRGMYGKSDKKFIKELEEAQKTISEDARKNVAHEIEYFFCKALQLAPELENKVIVNESLELAVHVRELHLDKPIVEGGRMTRSDILKAKIEELKKKDATQQEGLECYVLQQIDALWDLIQRAEAISAQKTPRFFGRRPLPTVPTRAPITPRSDEEME